MRFAAADAGSKDGCFNADPHPGNILMLEDGKTLGLIDFGQVMYVPVESRPKIRCRRGEFMVASAKISGSPI